MSNKKIIGVSFFGIVILLILACIFIDFEISRVKKISSTVQPAHLISVVDNINLPFDDNNIKENWAGPGDYEVVFNFDKDELNVGKSERIATRILGKNREDPDGILFQFVKRNETYVVLFSGKKMNVDYGYRWRKINNRVYQWIGRK